MNAIHIANVVLFKCKPTRNKVYLSYLFPVGPIISISYFRVSPKIIYTDTSLFTVLQSRGLVSSEQKAIAWTNGDQLSCIDVLPCRIICHKKIPSSACNIEHKQETTVCFTLYCQISFSVQRRDNNLHLHKTQRNIKPQFNLQDVGLFFRPQSYYNPGNAAC